MRAVLVWLLLCIIWGTTWIFIKIGLNDLPPVSFAGIRFLLAFVILLPIVFLKKAGFPKTIHEWKIIAITGGLQFFVNYGLLFWGEQHISSGLAAVLQATIPAFGLILARIYMPDEKITVIKILSILFGLIGVAVIFKEQLQLGGTLSFIGSLAIVVGAFAAAYASVLVKAYGREINPMNILCGQMIFGFVPLLTVGFAAEGNPLDFNWTWSAVICVSYLAVVGSIIAFLMYYWLLINIDVTKAMMISLVTPLVAVIIGGIYLGEKLAAQTISGGLLVLASVGLIIFRPLFKRKSLD
jgi:drug/metabolite transporter (DMT)-like permease